MTQNNSSPVPILYPSYQTPCQAKRPAPLRMSPRLRASTRSHCTVARNQIQLMERELFLSTKHVLTTSLMPLTALESLLGRKMDMSTLGERRRRMSSMCEYRLTTDMPLTAWEIRRTRSSRPAWPCSREVLALLRPLPGMLLKYVDRISPMRAQPDESPVHGYNAMLPSWRQLREHKLALRRFLQPVPSVLQEVQHFREMGENL